jgi:hypothetical protein
MTDERRYDYIEVAGGKFDGDTIRVELDEHGRPPATWRGVEMAPKNGALPPHLMHGAGVFESLYTLDQVVTAAGPKFVYRCDLTVHDDLGAAQMWNPEDPYGTSRRAA